jgi:hypothetical protein
VSDTETVNANASAFARMPRAIQWALLAAIGFCAFWVWDQYVNPLKDSWDKDAAAIETSVKDIRSTDSVSSRIQGIKDVVVTLGPVDKPASSKDGQAAVYDAVNKVLAKNGVAKDSFSLRSRGKLSKTALVSITSGNKRIDRLTGDLKFDATPKAAAAIIADLESNPDIEAVDSVRMTRDTNGKVKVHVTVEAWVLTTDSSSKGDAI